MNETFSLSNHSDSNSELSNKESESELLDELGNECEIFQECNNYKSV